MSEKALHLTSSYPATPNPTESQPSAQEWPTGPPGTSEGVTAACCSMPLHSIEATSKEPSSTDEVEFLQSGFSDKSVRRGFIRKVFLLLAAQMVATVGIVCIFMFVTPLKIWIQENLWFYILSFAVFIVTYILFGCFSGCRRRYPLNILCLVFFVLDAVFGGLVLLVLGLQSFSVLMAKYRQRSTDYLNVWVVTGNINGDETNTHEESEIVLSFILQTLVISMRQMVEGKGVEMSPGEYVYGAMELYVNIASYL
ncbi:unnamed protein product [Calicophoron daubneyi]|uniref:Uncharacterized protein n=1 Tax=Calicophoron daubneyi TaxID=300641 RepID=A0AAV2U2T6_CALDB